MPEAPASRAPAPSRSRRGRVFGMPSTVPGTWALRLLAASVVLFVIANIVVSSGQEGGDTIFDNLWISVPMLGAGAAMLTAGGLAAFAVIRRRERSILVFAPLVLGLLVLVFLVGEVTTPH